VRNGLEPAASPSGGLIAFQAVFNGNAGSGIAVVDSTGHHRRVIYTVVSLTRGVEFPSFSPDSSKIVFDDGASIWSANTNGTDIHRLLSLGHGRGAFRPVYSPDGRTILFGELSRRTGHVLGMFLVNADGSRARHVPHSTRRDSFGSFSPDGRTIVFGCGLSVCRMRIDGSRRHRLTRPPRPVPSNSAPIFDAYPRYSPDGTKIAFDRLAGSLAGGQWNGPHGLYVMNASGSGLRHVDNIPPYQGLCWQPLP
jgi:Tol biopolymer transport system component